MGHRQNGGRRPFPLRWRWQWGGGVAGRGGWGREASFASANFREGPSGRTDSGLAAQASAGMVSGGRAIRASSAWASAVEPIPPQPARVTTIETTSGRASDAPSRSWSLWLSTWGCKPMALASSCWVCPTARNRSRSASRNASRSRICPSASAQAGPFSEAEGHNDDLLGEKLLACFPGSCKCFVAESALGHRHQRIDG